MHNTFLTHAACVAIALVSAGACLAQKPRLVFKEAHYPGWVEGVAFSPDGKRLVSIGLCRGLIVWDLALGKRHAAHDMNVGYVAYHPAGKMFASAGRDGVITLHDADSAKPRNTLKGHTDWIWAISFSSDGKLLASASSDKTVKLWDMNTAREKATLRHTRDVYQVTFLKGDKRLVTGSDAVRVWDVAGGKEVAIVKKKDVEEVSVLAVAPDGNTVAFAVDGEKIKPQVILWDVRTQRERPGPDLEGQIASSLAFSPDGALLAIGVSDAAVIWDVSAGKRRVVLTDHYGPATPLTFSPDGGTLASGDCETTIRLWDTKGWRKPGR